MLPVRIPRFIQRFTPNVTWHIPGNNKVVYLTFDDGPTPGVTENVLEILERFDVKATFFCIGRNVERHPDLYLKIIAKGHLTGNHTYSHLKGWYTGNVTYFSDIELAGRLVNSTLYRPAYGMITPSQVRYLKDKYRIFMWSVLSYDYDSSLSPKNCFNNVTRFANNGSIIVFHDSVKAAERVLFSLPGVIEHFKTRGFSFNLLPS